MLPELRAGYAEQVQGIDMLGIDFQNLAIERFGLPQVAGPLLLDGQFERLCDRDHCRLAANEPAQFGDSRM